MSVSHRVYSCWSRYHCAYPRNLELSLEPVDSNAAQSALMYDVIPTKMQVAYSKGRICSQPMPHHSLAAKQKGSLDCLQCSSRANVSDHVGCMRIAVVHRFEWWFPSITTVLWIIVIWSTLRFHFWPKYPSFSIKQCCNARVVLTCLCVAAEFGLLLIADANVLANSA